MLKSINNIIKCKEKQITFTLVFLLLAKNLKFNLFSTKKKRFDKFFLHHATIINTQVQFRARYLFIFWNALVTFARS